MHSSAVVEMIGEQRSMLKRFAADYAVLGAKAEAARTARAAPAHSRPSPLTTLMRCPNPHLLDVVHGSDDLVQ